MRYFHQNFPIFTKPNIFTKKLTSYAHKTGLPQVRFNKLLKAMKIPLYETNDNIILGLQ